MHASTPGSKELLLSRQPLLTATRVRYEKLWIRNSDAASPIRDRALLAKMTRDGRHRRPLESQRSGYDFLRRPQLAAARGVHCPKHPTSDSLRGAVDCRTSGKQRSFGQIALSLMNKQVACLLGALREVANMTDGQAEGNATGLTDGVRNVVTLAECALRP